MPTTLTSSSPFRVAVLSSLAVFAILATTRALRPASAVPGETTEDVPLAVDLRPRFANVGLTARAQGPRSTCSVFTEAGAMEYALGRQDGTTTRLSVEFLNWASNAAINKYEDGSYFSDLWKGYQAFGICDEVDQPYRDEFARQLRPGEETLKRAAQRQEVGLTG